MSSLPDLDWYVCNLRGLFQPETYAEVVCRSVASLNVNQNSKTPNKPMAGKKVTEITYSDLTLIFERDKEIIKTILRGGRHRFQEGNLDDGTVPAVHIDYIELIWLQPDGTKHRKFGPVSVSIWDYESHWVNGVFLMDKSSMVREQFFNYQNREIYHETVNEWKKRNQVQADHFSFNYLRDPIHKMSLSAELLKSTDIVASSPL